MKHSVSHIKVFLLCHIYAHIPKVLRNKLDNKGEKCIFVGYSEETKRYKWYDHVTRKVIINCNIEFVENGAWDGTIEKNVKIVSPVTHDDMRGEVVETTHVSQNVVVTSTSMTVRLVPAKSTSTQVTTQATPVRTPRAQKNPSSSSKTLTSS